MTLSSVVSPEASTRDLEVRRIERETSSEVFLTGEARSELSFEAGARRLYEALAQRIAEEDVQPFQEKVYGRLRAREGTLAIRAAAFEAAGVDPSLPCTFLEGTPMHDGDLAGVQLWGVVSSDPTTGVATIGTPGKSLARCWSGPDYRLLHFPAIQGLERGAQPSSVTSQAERMFDNVLAALADHGLTFLDVPRTWITMARILDWYGEFNRVRTALFRELGVGDGPERAFPASTGIQGRTAEAEACCMGLLAVEGAGLRVTPLHRSCRQSPSFDYGSAFSRAMSLELEGQETVLVSGTASIDSAGQTLHTGDAEAQVLETLLSIAALLETRGAGLKDICQATLFCKTPEVLTAYRQAVRLLDVPAFPVVPVLADVCRHDLLVEIEAVARVPQGESA